MTEHEAAAPMLAEMAADAAMIRMLADLEPTGGSSAALRDQAARIDSWRDYMRRLAVTLDEIAANQAEDARLAEEQARWRAMRARADVLPFRRPAPEPLDPRPAP